MPTPTHLRLRTEDPANLLWPFVGLFLEHLSQGRYHETRRRKYIASTLHFGDWLRARRIAPENIDEKCIRRFLSEHGSGCTCTYKTPSSPIIMRAALNNLLRVLRAKSLIGSPTPNAVETELSRFSSMLAEVWGLSPETRRQRCNVIRRLLAGKRDDGRTVLGNLNPSHLRAFIMGDERRKPATIRNIASAVRCYLRYRALLGDDIHHLQRAIPTPSFKPALELPRGLTPIELEQLLCASTTEGQTCKRAHAILRCLADLGLRTLEVTRLTLDDIDWQNGLVRVPTVKARRSDIMPLPAVTGEAIANYLVPERPATDCREVFVRHIAPIGEPIGRRAVQRSLHKAYQRLGWNRTRVHILRHTIASKLVNDAVPLKQVADVMRHRSVVTTAGYVRVDQARLSAVALPWPGDNS
ncbi:tyrosine-type recombinase/integrase [Rhizobium leguminosarum]|uniref:Tyrosine-type recombinase/integrase n=1 Tax=Rhizobium leguminosarum TaxID=384 RepID=A0A7K3VQS4_RHILE|nr:tyrosine-type recombinase/integrase [Rhizobium leguminosarum]NEK19493.1 tyrosine-type recombinase/integrase [Rhizobium leguminosarum]